MKTIISILLFILIFTQCKPAHERKCFKTNGSITSISNADIYASVIQLEDDISLHLIQDSLNYYELVGGENILPFIDASVESNRIVFRNNNKCHFSRNRISVDVYYHYTTLDSIYLNGFGDCVSEDTIYSSLTIKSQDSYSTLDLIMDNDFLTLVGQVGSIEANLKGKCNYLYAYSNGAGSIDASELHCKIAHGHSQGIGDFYLNATDEIIVELRSRGNFFITKQTSTQANIIDEGEGEVIYK